MVSRIFAFLFLFTVAFSPLATAFPNNPSLEPSQHTIIGKGPPVTYSFSPIVTGTASEVMFMIERGTTFFEIFIYDVSTTYDFTATALTLSTFSEISPIWSAGSPLTLSTLVAGSGFAATASTRNVISRTTVVMTTETSITFVSPSPSIPSVPGTMVTSLLVTSTTTTSTVFAFPSGTTSGAVSYATSTSKAAASTLVAGLGSLLGVAVGVVALL